MDLVAHAPPSLAPTSGGGIIALVQAVLQRLLSPDLTAEERALLEHLKSVSVEVGSYVLDAEDREDIVARIDTVLDDPAYYETVLSPLVRLRSSLIVRTPADGSGSELFSNVIGPFLGPAALPHLREVQRSSGFLVQWVRSVAQLVPSEVVLSAIKDFSREPLAFLHASSPLVPVPVARSLLAQSRNDLFFFSACALVFERRSVEPWFGLAFAELWAATLREALVLPASINSDSVPLDIVPLENRLDLDALRNSATLTELAYARFNTDAEHSGEPVYPSLP